MRRLQVGLGLVFATIGAVARAELPPQTYQKWQREAPEALTIQVQALRTMESRDRAGRTINVTVRALVKAVKRSET